MLRELLFFVAIGLVAGGQASLRPTLTANKPINHNTKIINGVDANEGEFPHIVSLNYAGDGHACGASVLTDSWILTAAHCCLTGVPMEIYAGSIYLSNGGQKYPISQYIINGDYNPDEHWKNDICLIKLATPLPIGDKIKPVALPTQDMAVPSGTNLTIPGWGAISTEPGTPGPDRLQVLHNQALSNDECISTTGVDIDPGQICTFAGKDHATCSGDSGGPLSKNGVQVGIVSWGYIPCGIGMPDVFTRVPHYINWINQVLASDFEKLVFAQPEDLL